MKPVSFSITHRKKISWLLAGWILIGLIWPAAGFMISGNSQVLKDIIVGFGCLGVVAIYLATLVVLFQHIQDLGHHMGLVASAFMLSAMCLIIIFASYIAYFNLYLQGAISGYTPMMHEDLFDPFYMSATTFTTVGIGDVFPQGFAGKFLVATEALVGVTHSVSFVALLMVRISMLESKVENRKIQERAGQSGSTE